MTTKVKNGESVTLEIGEADVTLPAAAIARMWLDKFQRPTTAPAGLSFLPVNEPPKLGREWPGQGGVYAGIARGQNGEPDYHLIVGPEAEKELSWNDAATWAQNAGAPAHADFRLPKRHEQALCYANVPELFKKEWYWSCEEYAPGSGYAWMQDFSYGGQGDGRKGGSIRARAVRRLVIE